MDIAITQRFRSGQCCPESGWYVFDGYTDGSLEPFPATGELEIALQAGDVFPPIRHVQKACCWRREVAACDDGLLGGLVLMGSFPMELGRRRREESADGGRRGAWRVPARNMNRDSEHQSWTQT